MGVATGGTAPPNTGLAPKDDGGWYNLGGASWGGGRQRRRRQDKHENVVFLHTEVS